MAPQTTIEMRILIIQHYKSGKSQRVIADMVQRPRGTIKNIIKRYNDEKRIANKPKHPGKKVLTDRDERWVLQRVKLNPRLSAPILRDMLVEAFNTKCSATTIRRVLYKAGLHGRITRKKPLGRAQNKKNRLEYAHTYYMKDVDIWKNEFFVEEFKFNLFES